MRRSVGARLAWGLFLLVDLPLVAVVAAGLAAVWLPPGPFWWAQLVAVGLPYAAWALAAATIGPLLAWRGRWLLLHAVLLGLVAWRAAPGETRPPAPLGAPGPADLVLTSFNLPESGPSRDALGDSAVAFVLRTAPDLLLFQDAWAYDARVRPEPPQGVQIEAIAERLPYRLALPGNLASPGSPVDGGTGVPVFVRSGAGLDVVEQQNVVLGEPPSASIAIRSQVRWRGRELVVYNVHLRSFGDTKPWEDPDVRPDSVRSWIPYLRQYRRVFAQRGRETEALATRIEAETLPVVVAGDFNSTADHWNTRRLRTAGRPAGEPRVDAFRAVGGRTWGRTYHAQRPIVRIDFVLVDPALDVVGADVADVGFSDHRPVRVHLRWAAPADSSSASSLPPEGR